MRSEEQCIREFGYWQLRPMRSTAITLFSEAKVEVLALRAVPVSDNSLPDSRRVVQPSSSHHLLSLTVTLVTGLGLLIEQIGGKWTSWRAESAVKLIFQRILQISLSFMVQKE